MDGVLHSDDAVTRVMHGQHVDFVPVAQAYETIGPLQYLRVERNWQLWRRRLDEASAEVLPVSYEMYLSHRMEIETEILGDIYRRPAWYRLMHNETPEEIEGSAVVRRGDDLFWLSKDGEASWIWPTLEGTDAARGAGYSELWSKGDAAAVLEEAAAEPEHPLDPIPEPTAEQVDAVARSQQYDLAKALAKRFPNELPLYTRGTSPYNGLPYRLGFSGMTALIEMPDKVHSILRRWVPGPSASLAAQRKLGVSLMHIEECNASADILSPRMYEEFVFQYDKPAIQFYEDMGFRTMLYFSGNLMPLLEKIKELPFTALCFEEDRKNYGIDLAEVRRVIGPDKVLFGNLDAWFVERASDEEVLAEVKRQIDVAGPHNFIVSLGSPLTPGTTLERVRLYTESTRRI
ncbi:MAG: uroporphyrinogen decarboxylase family protein [Armatimonadota bacterium]